MKEDLKWKPMFSFLCILASLFFIGSLFNIEIGGTLVAFVSGVFAFIAGIFPDHFANIRTYWFDRVLPATHLFFIWLSIALALATAFIFFKKYKLSLNIVPR